jgi:DNA-binding NtrC family response regulator
MIAPQILLLDSDPPGCLGDRLRDLLQAASLNIRVRKELVDADGSNFRSTNAFIDSDRSSPDLIFLVLPTGALEKAAVFFRMLDRQSDETPVIIVIESGSPDDMVALLNLGAADFITPPLKAVDILPRVWRLLEQHGNTLLRSLKEKIGLKQLIGISPAFLSEMKKIPLLAKCDVTVLISGETGTGKELCAQAVHYLSQRSSKPFVPINCGAIPVELAENELFGHQRGAFTSASATQVGLVHEADGGTLFLDEVDSLPPAVQIKLLRFLQEKEYRPLGSSKTYRADVRVIAASNDDPEEAAKKGKLRQDLYYRLNVIPLNLPPLRLRREDIPLLARHFLAKYSNEFKKRCTNFSVRCMHALMLYEWPGNVRELQHAVERAVALSEHETIRLADLALPRSEQTTLEQPFREAKAMVIAQFEKKYIQDLLLVHQGNITKAAEASRKNRRAFWQLMRKHHIQAGHFRSGAF